MKKIYAIFILLMVLLPAPSGMLSAQEWWQHANDAYAMGDFESAVALYRDVEEKGKVNADLYYNLGNSYYRLGDMGKAVLYYERALKLDPSDKDAKANLRMAQTRTIDKIDAVPEFVVTTWIRNWRNSASSDSWAIFAVVLLAIALLLLLVYLFARKVALRKVSFIVSYVMLFFMVVAFLFSLSLARVANSLDNAVVINSVGNVKSSPNVTGNNIFILHEGTKVEVLESVQGWSKIEIADGRQGWIQSEDIEVI